MEVTPTWEKLDAKNLSVAIAEKNSELRRYHDGVKGQWDEDKLSILRSRNEELEKMVARKTMLDEAESTYRKLTDQKKSIDEPVKDKIGHPNGDEPRERTEAIKSMGELFTDSMTYKGIGMHSDMTRYGVGLNDFLFGTNDPAIKTVMTTSAGYAPPNPRTDIVIPAAQRTPTIADVIPVDPTNVAVVKYMEETTALAGTNAQVAVSEGSSKFQNTLAFTERTVTVEAVATYLPVTNQQLDDVPAIQGIINNRMNLFLRLKEEDLLLNGTGSTPQITGFLVKSGTNTQARGTDTNIDCLFKGIQACRVTGFAEPDAIIMHPDNFTPIQLYKDSNGNYSFSVTQAGGVTQLFGKTLIVTPAMTSGTALVGAFGLYSHISRKMGMTIAVGLVNDDFIKNQQTIRAEYRDSLEIYRAAAFTKCTGLN